MKRKLIAQNPFEDISEVAVGLPNTKRFITRDETAALLDVADVTWRAIIGLGRYGGLRCPSEVASLRWEDIDWEKGWMTVTSPKTEHHKGRETRLIPLFLELETVLRAAFEAAPEGAVYVIGSRLREKALKPRGWRACSLRPQFIRLIKRAGLKPWPRPFHNLRASRETELMHEHPIHVVTAWLGNSPQIAMKHYCMVTEEDFKKARRGNQGTGPTGSEKSGANSDARVAQNPALQPRAAARSGSHDSHANPSQDATSATPGVNVRNRC